MPRWVLFPVLLLFAAVVAAILAANPLMPDAAELDDVKTDPPARPPVSTALREHLARTDRAPPAPVVERALERLRAGAWPESPAELARTLDALAPPLEERRGALLAPGCHPEEEHRMGEEPPPEKQVRYDGLLRTTRQLALRACARAALDGPASAATGLAALHRRLLALERGCSPGLIAAMVLHVAVGVAEQALALLLSHPGRSEETSRLVWERLLAGEARPSSLPDALRWELRFQRGLVDALERREETNAGPPLVWPWYSRGATLALIDQLGRRTIWLAERPLTDSKAWSGRFPEEEYLARLQRQPRPLLYFRHNAIGKILLALGPDLRKYVLKWHQARCLALARRARLVRELLARRRPVPDEALRPARDPRTGSVFRGDELGLVCGLPPSYTRGNPALVAGARTVPLAPAPAALPTSTPTPRRPEP
jgi:hypothetical protein